MPTMEKLRMLIHNLKNPLKFGRAAPNTGGGGGGTTIFTDDFASLDFAHSQSGIAYTSHPDVDIVAASPIAGRPAARFFMRADDNVGPPHYDAIAELRLQVTNPAAPVYPELWTDYLLHIPVNYRHRVHPNPEFSSNNKGFLYAWDRGGSSTYESSHVAIGTNFWPNGDAQETSLFTQHSFGSAHPAGIHYWHNLYPQYYPHGTAIIEAADYGKVLHIVCHNKYASPANNDGVSEIWKRRLNADTLLPESGWIKLLDIQDGAWYSAGQEGFGTWYILGWANSGFDEDTYLHVTDIRKATVNVTGAA